MKYLLLLSLLLKIFTSEAQTISELKTATAFIYVANIKGELIPNGTCFLINIPSQDNPSGVYIYLITAKHVFLQNDSTYYNEVFVRLNTSDTTSEFARLSLQKSGPAKNIFVHRDSTVDIAVVPILPTKKYKIAGLTESFLFDKQSYRNLPIPEGTEVFFTGLFTPYTGEKSSVPIVRFGRIALIPNEKISWINKKREMILLESSSYGGNSGAPVYFRVNYPDGKSQLVLGGVLNGTFRDVAKLEIIQNAANGIPVTFYNNGISGITPTYLLYEILFSDELKSVRK